MPPPSPEELLALPRPSAARPFRILLSGCLTGRNCGFDGSNYGGGPLHARLARVPHVELVSFCPEDFAFGTPRDLCDIHGGNGFDVLDGRACVLTQTGEDWTAPLVEAAHRMLALATQHAVDLALLMDMSAACGSQVISDGPRTVAERKYQRGPGVCTALLLRHGIRVMSQRDFRALEWLLHRLDPAHVPDSRAIDHHETPWYREYFGTR